MVERASREEGKDRMKEPQSFRFRAAAAATAEDGLPSFPHLLRYPLASSARARAPRPPSPSAGRPAARQLVRGLVSWCST